jgi:hypothetical protein
VEQVVDMGDSASRAMQAFAVLSDMERRVVEMRLIEEASPASVARALGLTSGNVRVIQSRALVKMRRYLRSRGEGRFAQPIITVAAMADFVRYLRGRPATDRFLGQWVEELRSSRSDAMHEGAVTASGVGIIPSAIVTTTRAADSAHSLLSAVTSSGVARFGAWASVVALAAAPLVPALVPGAESSSSVDQEKQVIQAQEVAQTLPWRQPDNASAGAAAPATGGITLDTPTSAETVTIESPRDEAGRDLGLPAVEQSEPTVVTVPGLVADDAEPLVTDTVEALVDNMVEPVVDQVVGVVETTVEVVGELVDPVVDEVVESLIDDVTDSVGGVVPGLGGLLGGR